MADESVGISKPRVGHRPIIRIVAVVVGFVVLAVGIWATQGGLASLGIGQSRGVLRVGQRAPNFALKNVDGSTVQLSSYRGQPILINFWATWCPPCQSEMPAINAVAREHRNLVVLAVDAMEGPVLVQRYQVNHPYAFKPLLDPKGNIVSLYHVDGLPTSFFVGPDGVIHAINVGPMTQPTIEKYLQEI